MSEQNVVRGEANGKLSIADVVFKANRLSQEAVKVEAEEKPLPVLPDEDASNSANLSHKNETAMYSAAFNGRKKPSVVHTSTVKRRWDKIRSEALKPQPPTMPPQAAKTPTTPGHVPFINAAAAMPAVGMRAAGESSKAVILIEIFSFVIQYFVDVYHFPFIGNSCHRLGYQRQGGCS